ncbi:MAG: hypothetical protein ACKOC9_09240, partial [Alphaproteobacteria bacterium]
MKLFYAPGACSIGIHVMLEEIGAPYEAVAVNLREGAQFQPGFTSVNPKSKVPALFLLWIQVVDGGLFAGIAYLISLIAAHYRKTIRIFFRAHWLRRYWDGVSLALAFGIIILFLLKTLELGQFFGAIG